MKRRIATLSLALPAVFMAGSILGPTQGPKVDLSTVVGVVDIDRVSKNYAKAKQMHEALKQDVAAFQAAAEQRKQEIQALEIEMSGYDQFSEKWAQTKERLEGALAAAKGRAEAENARFTFRQIRQVDEVYQDVQKAVSALAEKAGLQIVLRVHGSPDVREANLEKKMVRWEQWNVLYHTKQVDLTEKVILFLKTAPFAQASATNGNK